MPKYRLSDSHVNFPNLVFSTRFKNNLIEKISHVSVILNFLKLEGDFENGLIEKNAYFSMILNFSKLEGDFENHLI